MAVSWFTAFSAILIKIFIKVLLTKKDIVKTKTKKQKCGIFKISGFSGGVFEQC